MTQARLKRLLALTDFSAPARHAAERAAMVAKETGAALDLLHVMNSGLFERLQQLGGGLSTEVEERLLDTSREALQHLAETLMRHRDVTPGIHVAKGTLLRTLLEQADQMRPDLLVLGAHGASYMRHLLLGSTAERMLRMAVQPVLVVKQQPHEGYRKVLVPVDFSACSLRALRLAQAVAPGAEFVVFHAFEVPFESTLQYAGIKESEITRLRASAQLEADTRLREFVRDSGLARESTTALALHGNATRHIVEQEQESDCDLIVIGKHGELLVEDLLLGSVTKHVLVEAQGDVLVVI